MFARPRERKTAPPPPKKRKREHAIEEINFDDSAREEYLTGFHKRKLQRVKHAQEEAAKRARQEKIEMRKQMREERQRAVEEHVTQVNALLKEHQEAGHIRAESETDDESEEWKGFADDLIPDDHEEEYIDEDKYTTVTVESVSIDRDGLHQLGDDDSDEDERSTKPKQPTEEQKPKPLREKKKKKKFRYENKFDRQLTERKQKAKRTKGR